MCSYDRAYRWPKVHQRTLPSVGPNTYYLPEKCDQPSFGYAPFLSFCPRVDGKADRVSARLPSAADYNVVYRGKRVTGGNSMGYKDSRFKEMKVEGPGPGEYELRNPRETKAAMERTRKRGKGKLYQCRVPYQLGECPPSIPHRTNCHGYEIDKLGALTANPPSYHDLTIGPAFYDTLNRDKSTCDQYKGCGWSYSKTKRPFIEGKEGPGPGQYEVATERPEDPAKIRDEQLRFQKRKCSKQPRLAEIIDNRTRRENLPGPGYYDVPPAPKPVKKKRNFCGFLSSGQRFTYRPDENPAPGDYEVNSTICAWKPGSVKRTGFLMDANRFPKAKQDNLPGPADYEILGLAEMMQRKLDNSFATKIPGFNSCSERVIGFLPKDAASIPAPNHYDPQPIKCIQTACTCSAVFKSKVPRGKSTVQNTQASCASYDVDDAYRKLKCRQSHRKLDDPRKSQFNSKNPRFGPITDMETKREDFSMPGPADYSPDAEATLRKRDAGTWGTGQRFTFKENDNPGPGHYKLHLKMRETTLKGTYNSTLGNPLPNPLSNVKPWLQQATARKRIRWFVDDFDHCKPLICCRSAATMRYKR